MWYLKLWYLNFSYFYSWRVHMNLSSLYTLKNHQTSRLKKNPTAMAVANSLPDASCRIWPFKTHVMLQVELFTTAPTQFSLCCCKLSSSDHSQNSDSVLAVTTSAQFARWSKHFHWVPLDHPLGCNEQQWVRVLTGFPLRLSLKENNEFCHGFALHIIGVSQFTYRH